MQVQTELQELQKITNTIKKLKEKRVNKFGKKWYLKLANCIGHRWDDKTKLEYAKKIEEYIALNNLTIGRAMQHIGIHRNVFNRLRKKSINSENQNKIEAFFNAP